MKTRVAKSITGFIAQSILWSLILSGIAGMLTWTGLSWLDSWEWERNFWTFQWASWIALAGGLIVWPSYIYIRSTMDRRRDHILLAVGWIVALTVLGGIAGIGIGGPFAFASSVMTFALYETSTRVRFARNKQGKGYRLVRI